MKPNEFEFQVILAHAMDAFSGRTPISSAVAAAFEKWESIRPSDRDEINRLQAELKAAKEALPEWIPVTEKIDRYVTALDPVNQHVANYCGLEPNHGRFTHYIEKVTLANLPKREPAKADPVELERKEFEQWAEPRGYALNWSAGNYVSPRTDNAWQGWRGGRDV